MMKTAGAPLLAAADASSGGEALARRIVRASAVFMPFLVLAGYLARGWATFAGFAIVFAFYFLVEIWLHVSKHGITTTIADEHKYARGPAAHAAEQVPLYVYGVSQVLLIATVLSTLHARHFEPFEVVGITLSLGAMSGSVGGLAGHEFIHRRGWERALGVAVYGSVNYAHFAVTHIAGHHRFVGLPRDWGTARRDESVYAFLFRAVVVAGYASFRLESARLRRQGLRWWSPKNFVLRYLAFQLALWPTLYVAAGPVAVAVFGFASVMAIVLMEIVNYLSHYGLSRKVDGAGRPEPVQNKHSWESNNKVTNWFIFNAGKHSHHHRHPTHTHDELTLCHEKPYLPHGLPLMTLIALVPPLYFRLMNPLLDRTKETTPS
jgi:alkane 1-monooxygenase